MVEESSVASVACAATEDCRSVAEWSREAVAAVARVCCCREALVAVCCCREVAAVEGCCCRLAVAVVGGSYFVFSC